MSVQSGVTFAYRRSRFDARLPSTRFARGGFPTHRRKRPSSRARQLVCIFEKTPTIGKENAGAICKHFLRSLESKNNNTEETDFSVPFDALGASGAKAENVEYAGVQRPSGRFEINARREQ